MFVELFSQIDPVTILAAAGWIFLGAAIRGYSGFGSAAIAVAGLSLLLDPDQVIPLILMLETIAGFHMLPRAWEHIDWKQLRWISLGAVIATPIGIALLANLPADIMRLIIYAFIFIMALMIGTGASISRNKNVASSTTAGIVSGITNGAAGVGGLPLVVYFLSNNEKAATLRATLVAFFIGIDLYTCGIAATQGLIGIDLLLLAALMVIPLILGTALGSRHFDKARPQSFKRFALILLVLISSGGILRTLLEYPSLH